MRLELTRSISGGDVDVVAQKEIETVEVASGCGQMKPGLEHKTQLENEVGEKVYASTSALNSGRFKSSATLLKGTIMCFFVRASSVVY